jgi:hypothetical protein
LLDIGGAISGKPPPPKEDLGARLGRGAS